MKPGQSPFHNATYACDPAAHKISFTAVMTCLQKLLNGVELRCNVSGCGGFPVATFDSTAPVRSIIRALH